jgi:hypothetical protein
MAWVTLEIKRASEAGSGSVDMLRVGRRRTFGQSEIDDTNYAKLIGGSSASLRRRAS